MPTLILLSIADIAERTGHHYVSVSQALKRQNIEAEVETPKGMKLYPESVVPLLREKMRAPISRKQS